MSDLQEQVQEAIDQAVSSGAERGVQVAAYLDGQPLVQVVAGVANPETGRAVTADTALRLARFFGTSPEFWMNLQAMYDLTKARRQSGGKIQRDVRPRAA